MGGKDNEGARAELLLAVHRAMGLFAQIGECSAEGIMREIIC
jgi:hypothetical protein